MKRATATHDDSTPSRDASAQGDVAANDEFSTTPLIVSAVFGAILVACVVVYELNPNPQHKLIGLGYVTQDGGDTSAAPSAPDKQPVQLRRPVYADESRLQHVSELADRGKQRQLYHGITPVVYDDHACQANAL